MSLLCSGIFRQNEDNISNVSDTDVFNKKSKKKKRKNKRPTTGDETVAKKNKGRLRVNFFFFSSFQGNGCYVECVVAGETILLFSLFAFNYI